MSDLTADQIEQALDTRRGGIALASWHDLVQISWHDLVQIEMAASLYAALLRDVESGRIVIVDRLCQTCGGSGKVLDSPFAGGKYGGLIGPCPHCTDGLVPYIALTKQGGEWVAKAIAPFFDTVDALRDAVGGER